MEYEGKESCTSRAIHIMAMRSDALCLAFAACSRTQRALAAGRLRGLRQTRYSGLQLADEDSKIVLAAYNSMAARSGGAADLMVLPRDLVLHTRVLQISVGPQHLAFLVPGKAFALGSTRDGRLGFSARETSRWCTTPREIVLPTESHISKVACGLRHTVVMTEHGMVFSFGLGRGGRLGHGLPCTTCFTPTYVKSLNGGAVDCAAGTMHSAFIMVGGDAFTCGVVGDGRLGLGPDRRRAFTPQRVLFPSERSIRAVAISTPQLARHECGGHTLFLTDDGTVYGTGSCGNARIGVRERVSSRLGYHAFSRSCYSVAGTERSVDIYSPVRLPLAEPVICIAAGEDSSALLTARGKLATFGSETATAASIAGEPGLGPGKLVGMLTYSTGLETI